jgi:hypothetical protein
MIIEILLLGSDKDDAVPDVIHSLMLGLYLSHEHARRRGRKSNLEMVLKRDIRVSRHIGVRLHCTKSHITFPRPMQDHTDTPWQ